MLRRLLVLDVLSRNVIQRRGRGREAREELNLLDERHGTGVTQRSNGGHTQRCYWGTLDY
jgi:hypothetical protein